MEEIKTIIIVYGTIITAVTFVALLYVIEINGKLHRFVEWLRHNNPGNEIDIIMGDGYRYKIKMDNPNKKG